jgi:hypothetical protein
MNRAIAPTSLAILFVIVFVLGMMPKTQAGENENKECSTSSLRGSFGFTSSGALVAAPAPLAGPFGEIGRQTFDGSGNTDGAATLSANGNIRNVTVQGSYVVNSDCTGSMTLSVSPFGSTVPLDFVIDDDGAELRAIVTNGGAVESRVYRKQFPRGHHE